MPMILHVKSVVVEHTSLRCSFMYFDELLYTTYFSAPGDVSQASVRVSDVEAKSMMAQPEYKRQMRETKQYLNGNR